MSAASSNGKPLYTYYVQGVMALEGNFGLLVAGIVQGEGAEVIEGDQIVIIKKDGSVLDATVDELQIIAPNEQIERPRSVGDGKSVSIRLGGMKLGEVIEGDVITNACGDFFGSGDPEYTNMRLKGLMMASKDVRSVTKKTDLLLDFELSHKAQLIVPATFVDGEKMSFALVPGKKNDGSHFLLCFTDKDEMELWVKRPSKQYVVLTFNAIMNSFLHDKNFGIIVNPFSKSAITVRHEALLRIIKEKELNEDI